MSDREDDLKIGVKSTAIWLGHYDILAVGLLQTAFVFALVLLMVFLNLSLSFMFSICLVAGFFMYQQWLIRGRERQPCFQAFLNNGWVGAVVWFGLLAAF